MGMNDYHDILSLAIMGFLKNQADNAENLCNNITRFLGLIKIFADDDIIQQLSIHHIKKHIQQDSDIFTVTIEGDDLFKNLMTRDMPVPMGDEGRMLLILKLRFNHLLEKPMQEKQISDLRVYFDKEASRWRMLQERIPDPYCQAWVDLEREHAEAQYRWMSRLMPI